MKVHGLKVTQGESEFRGKIYPYHNVVIFGTEEITSSDGVGLSSEKESVQYNRFCEIMGINEVTAEIFDYLIGKNLAFFYDKYRKVNYFKELPVEETVLTVEEAV